MVLNPEDLDERMKVEGNCSALLAIAARIPEVSQRIGSSKPREVLEPLIAVLCHGTQWARGHACRALGNFAASDRVFRDEIADLPSPMRQEVLAAIIELMKEDNVNKRYGVMAIVNLVRADTTARHFLSLKEGWGALQALQGSSDADCKADADRAVALLARLRLGTSHIAWMPDSAV